MQKIKTVKCANFEDKDKCILHVVFLVYVILTNLNVTQAGKWGRGEREIHQGIPPPESAEWGAFFPLTV